MEFSLSINMDNADFDIDPDSTLADLLHGVARVAQCRATFDREGRIKDGNGNSVGSWHIEGD